MTEPGHSQKIQATVWKLTQGLIWKSTRQIHRIILRLYHISQLLILLLLFMTAPAPPSKNVGHCLEMIQDLSWRMLIQLCRLPCLGIQILGIHRFSFGHTGKCIHIMKEWTDEVTSTEKTISSLLLLISLKFVCCSFTISKMHTCLLSDHQRWSWLISCVYMTNIV